MTRPKSRTKGSINITINFPPDVYEFIVECAQTPYGQVSYGQVVVSIVQKYIESQK